MYVYFYSLHYSGSHAPIIRRINCISTSGICRSIWMTVGCADTCTQDVLPRESTQWRKVEKCTVILPKCRPTRYIKEFFTCRKVTIWDRRLYFPSEGRRVKDFFVLKIGLIWLGSNPQTCVPKTSTLPLDHQSRCASIFRDYTEMHGKRT
jgi:hypothetical protein